MIKSRRTALIFSGSLAMALIASAAASQMASAGLSKYRVPAFASATSNASASIDLPHRNPIRVASQARNAVVASLEPTRAIALPIRVSRDQASNEPVRAINTFRKRLRARVATHDVAAVKAALARQSNSLSTRKSGLINILHEVKPEGLPVKLAAAVITVESAWRVNARGSSGEYGLMQLMPTTARHYAPSYVKRLSGEHFGRVMMDPKMNLRVGTRVLHWCFKRAKGNVAATIGCYNRGPGKMWQWSENTITKRYVGKVKSIMAKAG